MADLQTITIQFKPKGDEVLVRAIKKLDNATRELQGQQKRYRKETQRLAPQHKKLQKQIRKQTRELAKLKKATKKADKANKAMLLGVRNLRNAGSKFGMILSRWRSKLLIVAFATGLVVSAFKRLFDRMIVQEKAERQLQVALGKTSAQLVNYAAALQQKTEFGDEAIISGMALIASVIKDEEAIKRATKATLDLASAKGMDLKTASDLVAKTIGSSTNALSRYGIQVEGAVGSTQRLDSLVRNISVLFGGQAAAAADTLGGAVAQLGNALGDLNEAMGIRWREEIADFFGGLKKSTEEWTETLKLGAERPMETLARHMEEVGLNADNLRKIIKDTDIKDLTKQAKELGSDETLGAFNKFMIKFPELKKEFDNLFGKSATDLDKMVFLHSKYKDIQNESIKAQGQAVELLEAAGISFDKMVEAAGKDEKFFTSWFDGLSAAGAKAIDDLQASMATGAPMGQFAFVKAIILNTTESFNSMNQNILLKKQEAQDILKDYFSLEADVKAEGEAAKQIEDIIKLFAEIEILKGGLPEYATNVEAAAVQMDFWAGEVFKVASAYNSLQQAQFNQFKKEELARINSIRSERKRAKEMEKFEKVAEAKQRKMNKRNQDIAVAETVMNTAVAIMKIGAKYQPPISTAMQILVGIQGALQVATIKAQKFERGGLVGGRRHSAGGTMIEAERGEFVMSRSAVNAVGAETMNRINAGGGAGNINISFAGNVMSDDFISEEAIPKIKEAIRRGADIGVS